MLNRDYSFPEGHLIDDPVDVRKHEAYQDIKKVTTGRLVIASKDDIDTNMDSIVLDRFRGDGEWNLSHCLNVRLCELSIEGDFPEEDFDLPDNVLAYWLRAREALHLGPLETFTFNNGTLFPEDINPVMEALQGTVQNLTIRGCANGFSELEYMWDSVNWEYLRGIRHFKLITGVVEPYDGNELMQDEELPIPMAAVPKLLHHIHPPKNPIPHLNLSTFYLGLHGPQDPRYGPRENRLPTADRLISALPRVDEVARFMVAIGGPLCQYEIQVLGYDDICLDVGKMYSRQVKLAIETALRGPVEYKRPECWALIRTDDEVESVTSQD